MPVVRHVGTKRVAGIGNGRMHRRRRWPDICRARNAVAVGAAAARRRNGLLNGPNHVSHLVAEKQDFLLFVAFKGLGERGCEQEARVGAAVGRVGRKREHRPALPLIVDAATGRADQRGFAEIIGHQQPRNLRQRSDIDLVRNDAPIVAVDEREFGQEELRNIGSVGVDVGKLRLAILEFPVAVARHATEGNRGRHERQGRTRRGSRGARFRRRWNIRRRDRSGRRGIDVERVPVEMTLIVLVGDENALRRRGVGTLHGAGELVFEKTRRPRIIGGGFGRAIQAARPRQELRCRVLERGFLACIQTGEGIDPRGVTSRGNLGEELDAVERAAQRKRQHRHCVGIECPCDGRRRQCVRRRIEVQVAYQRKLRLACNQREEIARDLDVRHEVARQRLRLDASFQRHSGLIRNRCATVGRITRERCGLHQGARFHRRRRVVALELAELPLPR